MLYKFQEIGGYRRGGHGLSYEISQEEGEYLIRLARESIEAKLGGRDPPDTGDAPAKMSTPCGVFVTLNKVAGTTHRLRGCIGFPYPVMPLVDAVKDAAVSAALKDPRFEAVTTKEMESIAVEVSVLTPPEVIEVERPDEYPGQVVIGRDGLIVSRGSKRGLLLPQVPVEWGWDAEEFLTQCCLKAWLPPDAWLTPGTEISRFRAIIYAEEGPRGAVRRVELEGS
jgi:uncharacterized protein (TIGR00296 family)